MQSTQQHTLLCAISFIGFGAHTRKKIKMTVKPAEANVGIVFLRTDIKDRNNTLFSHWSRTMDTNCSITLANNDDIKLTSVEHLLAVLRSGGVDNAIVEIDGPEVPVMDGMAAYILSLIEKHGVVEQDVARRAIMVTGYVEIREGNKVCMLKPSSVPRITLEFECNKKVKNKQTYSVNLTNDLNENQDSSVNEAKITSSLNQFWHQGMANAGVATETLSESAGKLVHDECMHYINVHVRHKILDVMGDLSMLGVPVIGHYFGSGAAHKMNGRLIKKMLSMPGTWSYVNMVDIETGNDSERNNIRMH